MPQTRCALQPPEKIKILSKHCTDEFLILDHIEKPSENSLHRKCGRTFKWLFLTLWARA